MASEREVKFTEADIKLFTKEQENTNMKKETSHDVKQFMDCFLQCKPKEIPAADLQVACEYSRLSSLSAMRGGCICRLICKSLRNKGLCFRFTSQFLSV